MEYDIESILEKYEDDYNPGPRPMAQEPRNMYAEGGRQGFDEGLSAKQKKALTITYPKSNKDLEKITIKQIKFFSIYIFYFKKFKIIFGTTIFYCFSKICYSCIICRF